MNVLAVSGCAPTIGALALRSKKLLLALALIAVLATASSGGARAQIDFGDLPPIDPTNPGLEIHPATISLSVIQVGGQARYQVEGAYFGTGKVSITAIGAKSGLPASIFPSGGLTSGPSFHKTTTLKPCKGNATVTGVYSVTAANTTTGATSNTLTITSCA
jgi:hypothetical protein